MVQVNSEARLGNVANTIQQLDGGGLQTTATFTTFPPHPTLGAGGGMFSTIANGQPSNRSPGPISGPGGLTKTGRRERLSG
jgi:hypothetical protein